MSKDYWREAIQVALEDCGAPPLTNEQLDSVADALDGAAETQSQYDGSECIPNPLVTEIDALQRKLAKEKRTAETRESRILEIAAYSHGCRPEQVHFDGHDITVDPR